LSAGQKSREGNPRAKQSNKEKKGRPLTRPRAARRRDNFCMPSEKDKKKRKTAGQGTEKEWLHVGEIEGSLAYLTPLRPTKKAITEKGKN